MTPVTSDKVKDLTTYHKPDENQAQRIERVNAAAAILLDTIIKEVPECADKSHAIRQVRDAKMWANVAISTNGLV